MAPTRLLVPILALAIAGCGGGDGDEKETEVVAVGPPAGAVNPCKQAKIGIDGSPDTAEGVCKLDGQTLVVANEDHAVDLGEIRVRLLGYEVKDEVTEGPEDARATYSPTEETDTWVFAEVEVENKSKSIGKPGKGWVIRAGGDKAQAFGINDIVDLEGLFESKPSIAPGETATGKLVFEMPKTVAKELGRDATLIAYGFSDSRRFEDDFFYKPKIAGAIRLYR